MLSLASHLFSSGKPWLVAVSGGVDSMALLHQLHRASPAPLVVVHMNHQLRGGDSEKDECFVRRVADSLNLPCQVKRVAITERMEHSKQSMETCARTERLRFFAECIRDWQAEGVFLGHHADDQAETILWNLMRGSAGIKGMREHSTMRVDDQEFLLVRPQLHLRRKALLAWMVEQGFEWREDLSNQEDIAIRNRLRNQVIPLLGECTLRDPVDALLKAHEAEEEREQMEGYLLSSVRYMDPQGRIHLPTVRGLPGFYQGLIARDYLQQLQISQISRALVREIVGMMAADGPPSVNLPGGGRLRRSMGRIWLDPSNPTDT